MVVVVVVLAGRVQVAVCSIECPLVFDSRYPAGGSGGLRHARCQEGGILCSIDLVS